MRCRPPDPGGSPAAIASIPAPRRFLTAVPQMAGAAESGVAGVDSTAYDIGQQSTADLVSIASVGSWPRWRSYCLASAQPCRAALPDRHVRLLVPGGLGLASFVFLRLVGDSGINFAIPILLFIFAMALGEDYNILLMTRVREEAHDQPAARGAGARCRSHGRDHPPQPASS